MLSEKNVETEQLKADLQRRLFDMKEYMKLVATLHNNRQMRDKKRLKKNPKFKTLNNTTLNTIVALEKLIPDAILMNQTDFNTETTISDWLDTCSLAALQDLNTNLMQLEKKQKIAKRWDKITDAFYAVTQALTPLTHIPILQILAVPIVNGLWGCWYACWAIAIGYDPALGGKIEPIKSTFNKGSYLAGGITTASIFLGLLFPPLLPIFAPIAAIGLLTSNVLWTAGAIIDFYKEIKDKKRDAGRNWRIADKASTVLYTVGSIVIAALAIAALFTPVGWAAGAAAVAFGIGAATASLAAFGISKFCQWRANVAEKREKAARIQTQDISSELDVQLTALNAANPRAQQTNTLTPTPQAENTLQATTPPSQPTPPAKHKKLHFMHLPSLGKKRETTKSVPTSTSSTLSTPNATTQPPTPDPYAPQRPQDQ